MKYSHADVCNQGPVDLLPEGFDLPAWGAACLNDFCTLITAGAKFVPGGSELSCPGRPGDYVWIDANGKTGACVCPEASKDSILPNFLGVGSVMMLGGVLYCYRDNPKVKAAMDRVRRAAAGFRGAVSDGCYAVLRCTGLTALAQEGSAPLVAPARADSVASVASVGSDGFSSAGDLERGNAGSRSTGGQSANPMDPSSSSYQKLGADT